MKKSLIAMAVLAAAGVASAQSSVTLYGVADLAMTDGNNAAKFQMTGNGVMNNGSSRLGVRGSEDLGGGLRANFNFEQGLNMETGATDAATFQRAAWMSLSGGFGTIQLGRTLSPSFFGIAAWELTGTANYSVVGNALTFANSTRNNSEISYATPNLSGFTAKLGYVTRQDNGGTASKYDLNLIYRGGPLTVGLSHNKTEKVKGNTVIGAKYNFGAFQLAGSYHDVAQINRRGFTVGGQANVGPVSLVLDIARENKSVKKTSYLLEAKYPLSKRTFGYFAYLSRGVAGGSSQNDWSIGLRHNF